MSERTALLSALRGLLSHPDTTFAATLARVTDPDVPVDVWQHTTRFAWRVGELSLDEVQELYDETFVASSGRGAVAGSAAEERVRTLLGPRTPALPLSDDGRRLRDGLARLEQSMRAGTDAEASVSAEVLAIAARMARPLEVAHNPYHHLLAALETLLGTPSGRG